MAHSAVLEHIKAFNAHDRRRLLAGLDENVVWSTGQDTIRGKAAAAELFSDELWELSPSLTVVRLLAGDQQVAAELTEILTVDGEERWFSIAGFFDLYGGLITRATIYRKGSADIT